MATGIGVDLDLGGIVESAGNILRTSCQDVLRSVNPAEIARILKSVGRSSVEAVKSVLRLMGEAKQALDDFRYRSFRAACIGVLQECESVFPLVQKVLAVCEASLAAQRPSLQAAYVEQLRD